MRNPTTWKPFFFVGAALLFAVEAAAQAPAPPVSLAAVPPALLNAKTVFISNAGADSGLFPHPFSGDPDRAYNEFYAAMQSWGRYQLVADPSEADVVLELRLIAPYGPSAPNKRNGASDPLPMFQLLTNFFFLAMRRCHFANLGRNFFSG